MASTFESIDAEPPLIGQLRSAAKTIKRTLWLYKKLLKPVTHRLAHVALAGVLLIGLNPFTSAHALAASGPAADTPALADFTFVSYEEVSLDEELAQVQADGFAPKPLVVTTEMGRPEREQRERTARAAEQRRLAAAQAAARARNQRAATIQSTDTTQSEPQSTESMPARDEGNTYAYGYCTWWAKTKRPDLPNQLGNGGAWLGNARRLGLSTGSNPQVGAVVVTSEGRVGHVGYVEAVDGGDITVSDMNMVGWGKISRRHMSASASVIKGFIY